MNFNQNTAGAPNTNRASNNSAADALSTLLASARPITRNDLNPSRLIDSARAAHEERNQALLAAAQIQRLNSSTSGDSSLASKRLTTAAIVDNVLAEEERKNALLRTFNSINSGTPQEGRKNALLTQLNSMNARTLQTSDPLIAAMLLQEKLRAQNDTSVNSFSATSPSTIQQHQGASLRVRGDISDCVRSFPNLSSLGGLGGAGLTINNFNLTNLSNTAILNNYSLRSQNLFATPNLGGTLVQPRDTITTAASSMDLTLPTTAAQKGRPATFPRKLYQMFSDLECEPGGTSIASFLPHGKAFAIHKPNEFVKYIIPKYFHMSSFASFQRQLNMYNFQQITAGPDKGAYYHEWFIRGQPQLCIEIKRISSKRGVS